MTDTHKDETKTDSTKWDFAKMFKVPEIDTEALMAAQRRNFEAMNTAGKVALDGMQAVAKRQAEMVRGSVERTTRSARDFVSAGTVSEKISKHAEASKATFETGVNNVREIASMVAKTSEGVFDVVSRRVSEGYDEVKDYASRSKKGGDDSPTDDGGATTETTTETTVEKDAA